MLRRVGSGTVIRSGTLQTTSRSDRRVVDDETTLRCCCCNLNFTEGSCAEQVGSITRELFGLCEVWRHFARLWS